MKMLLCLAFSALMLFSVCACDTTEPEYDVPSRRSPSQSASEPDATQSDGLPPEEASSEPAEASSEQSEASADVSEEASSEQSGTASVPSEDQPDQPDPPDVSEDEPSESDDVYDGDFFVASADPGDNVVTVTITAAGDCTLGPNQKHTYSRSFDEVYDNNDAAYFLKNVKGIFEADDFSIVNLECSLTNSTDIQTIYYNYKFGKWMEKTWNHKGKPEYVEILTLGSIEGVSMGNNHNMDYGQSGFDETVETVENAGLVWACDENLGYFTVKGIKIGFVSVNEHYDGPTRAEGFLKAGIEKLREECDLVLACVHWGADYDYTTSGIQKSVGRHCIDWGADMVIGNHPHVVQGVERYKGKYIYYSLGNFCYGSNKNPDDKDCLMVSQTFTFVNGELVTDDNVTLIPCFISSRDDRNNYQPTLAEGSEKQRIIEKVTKAAKHFGVAFDSEGHPVGYSK